VEEHHGRLLEDVRGLRIACLVGLEEHATVLVRLALPFDGYTRRNFLEVRNAVSQPSSSADVANHNATLRVGLRHLLTSFTNRPHGVRAPEPQARS
jgi:hypothetical protein